MKDFNSSKDSLKDFNAIIKNCESYNKKIKLASKLILYINDKSKRDGVVGCSTSQFGKYWFSTPKGQVLFKTGQKNKCEVKLLNEILCYRLAKQMGVDCAIYEPAQIDNKAKTTGVASFNFLKEGEQIISAVKLFGFQALNLQPVMDILISELHYYDDDEMKFDFSQIIEGLYKMTIFDLLTFQSDRHLGNISFIIDSKNHGKLSPMYDNEFAFCEMTRTCFDKYDSAKEFVDLLFYGDRTTHIKLTKKMTGLEGFNEYADQIISFAQKNPKYKKVLKNILVNANLREVYAQLESEGHEINPDYKQYTIHLFDFARTSLIEKYKQAFPIKKMLHKNILER